MIYTYETLSKKPRRFELNQSMTEPALIIHPTLHIPIRRVITGGSGFSLPKKPNKLKPEDYANSKCAMPDKSFNL